jgi:cellulose synthase operon protein YhjQ
MTDLNPLGDPNETPEDVATLYSWANLHGAKYRDFSAARAQTRERARLRAEQAVEEQQGHGQEEGEAAKATIAPPAAEEAWTAEAVRQEVARQEAANQAELAAEQAARQSEWGAQQAAEQAQQAARQAQQAAEQAAEQASRTAAEQAAQLAAQRAAQEAADRAAQRAAERAAQEQAVRLAAERAAEDAAQQAAERAAQQAAEQAAQREAEQGARRAAEQAEQPRAWQQLRPDRFPASVFSAPAAPYSPSQPGNFDYAGYGRPETYRPNPGQPKYAPAQYQQTGEENPMPPRIPWAPPEEQEGIGRPAWLSTDRPGDRFTDRPETPNQSFQSASSAAPDDTLQGSRDRMTSRWFALRGIFDGTPAQPEAIPAPTISRAPSMAVFSLAGGVGKTSLVATLGRALSARGERVLLVDTAAFGLLPFFFGATDQRPGQLRTFSPPGVSSDAPIQMVTIDPDGLGLEASNPESLSGEIAKYSRGVSRVIVDLATASGATTRRIMRMSPLVLVPVIPDMNSVVSVSSIDLFFEHNSNPAGKPSLPFYVLNQFDASLPLHLDVREVMREQLGERLLPFALRRTPAMSEALAEGMTVMDYAPSSTLAEDFSTLAGWVKSLSAPATTSYRGVRWSER